MSRYLVSDYAGLTPYTPGEQLNDRKYIKLNTNESPFPPSPRVREVLTDELIDRLNLYPDPTLKALREAIAEVYGLRPENIFCANGSDDIIGDSFMAFCGRGGRMCCPDVTYSFYDVFARRFGVTLTKIPLHDDFSAHAEDYYHVGQNIIIANPNAPTGLALTSDEVEQILLHNPDHLVFMDEAYMDFCGDSATRLLGKYPNLVVIMTYSKSRSLAGLRCGFALAHEDIISDYEKMKNSFNPYNLNALTIAAASAAMRDTGYHADCVREIVRVREWTKEKLRALGFTLTDSKSNFLFVKHPSVNGDVLYRLLRERGILVRYFSLPRIDAYIRVTVGNQSQMEAVTDALADICRKESQS